MTTLTRRNLRIAVLLAAAIGTLFWLGVCVRVLMIPPPRRDGFEMLGAILATAYFLALVLPALALGILGRWLPFGAVLGAVAVAIATDAVMPWIPWSIFAGGLF